ncbi:MAG: GntR family transcriptional regulator, partial [Clostridiales bacterium]|nr:GntR family transcriptional regulator [Clostridiales bacterium]
MSIKKNNASSNIVYKGLRDDILSLKLIPGSAISETDIASKYNVSRTPVRDAYAALWKEYKEAKSATVIMRTARQILEYYFIQISGYEGQTLTDRIMKRKDEFLEIRPDGTENREKQHLLNALLRYIGA